jgi:cytochrome b
MADGSPRRIRIWDLPTRLFHWALAFAIVGMLVTGRVGGNALEWHARLGYCIGALLLFRLAWGFAGGHWSRFAAFPPAPLRAWRYMRAANPRVAAGHSPIGGLSVYAMLAFLALQVASGLFSATKEDFAGPLSVLVSNATVHWLTGYHKNVGQWILIVLIGLHLAAIAFYFWRGRNLSAAMLHGDQEAEGPASRDDASIRFRALALLALSAMAMWGIVRLGA